MKTLKDFAEACRAAETAPPSQEYGGFIFNLFEDEISQNLRDEIYKLADANSNEPCRSSMIKLGYMFGVKTLIEY